MKIYVNATNQGNALGHETLDGIRALGVDGIRTDIISEGAEAQLREFKDYPGLQLLALIMGGKMHGTADTMVDQARHAARIAKDNLQMYQLPTPPIFELGNEPNIAGPKDHSIWQAQPELFGKTVNRAAQVIWDIMGSDTLVMSGGIHNPGRKAQEYLRSAARFFPPSHGPGNFAVGFHHYAPGMGDPDRPHDDFPSVGAQIESLKQLGYPLFDTESGGHTAGKERHNNQQIARWLPRRLEINEEQGILGSVVFQWNDGPDPNDHEHHFGLRDCDGELKSSAFALRDFTASRRA